MGLEDIAGAGATLLGSAAQISGGLMSRKANEVASRKQFEYNATLQNEAAEHNRQAMALQHGYNMDMANLNQENAMAMLQAQQDYNTRFAFNSQKMQANALRGAGLNPAAASAQLLQPGVSGPAAGSGQGSSAVGIGAAGTGLIADPFAGSMNAAGSLLGDSVLNITQSIKNLKDAGKSASESELNDIEARYRDKVLSQQIITQGLQNGILDYELAYKMQTFDESVKAVMLSNIESAARTQLTEEQKNTEIERQKQLAASADELQAQANRIRELVGAEKADLISRAASNLADAALSKVKIGTEKAQQAYLKSMEEKNHFESLGISLDNTLKAFEKDVRDKLGEEFFRKNERNKQALDDLALYWFNYKAEAYIISTLMGDAQKKTIGGFVAGPRVDNAPHGGK